jgi:hypothetical protein
MVAECEAGAAYRGRAADDRSPEASTELTVRIPIAASKTMAAKDLKKLRRPIKPAGASDIA